MSPKYITRTYYDTNTAIMDFFSSCNFSEGITKIIGLLTLTGGFWPLAVPKGPPSPPQELAGGAC